MSDERFYSDEVFAAIASIIAGPQNSFLKHLSECGNLEEATATFVDLKRTCERIITMYESRGLGKDDK